MSGKKVILGFIIVVLLLFGTFALTAIYQKRNLPPPKRVQLSPGRPFAPAAAARVGVTV